MPQKDPCITFYFLIEYEMGQKTHPIRMQRQIDEASGKVFTGVKGKLEFLTLQHPKNCINVS